MAIERTRTAQSMTVAPAHDGPTEAECDALFTHAMGLVLAEKPASDADQATLRAELRPGFITDCRGGSRATFDCGRAAKKVADLAACGPPKSANAE